jgi:hypothetical protein
MICYTGTYGITDIDLLLYKLTLWSKRFTFMFELGSSGYFVTGTPFMNMGHDYSFSSSVSYPRSDSVRLVVYDGMCTIFGALVLYYRSLETTLTLWKRG